MYRGAEYILTSESMEESQEEEGEVEREVERKYFKLNVHTTAFYPEDLIIRLEKMV